MEKIKVIIKRPEEVVGREERIDNTLEALQEAVGGYIETLTILRNPGVVMVINYIDDYKFCPACGSRMEREE